jgi:hypothetical protein
MISYRLKNINVLSNKKKYLIYFTQGGINDMLSRISDCYNYCVNYNRILVINSLHDWFKEDIRDYINFNSPIIYKGELNELYDKLNKETTYPPEFKGILNTIVKFEYSPNGYKYNNKIIDNNLSCDYTEIVKIYVDCGDSTPIKINILKISSFTNIVLDIFRERFNKLPNNYVSVHIRNTDKSTNVDEFLDQYKNELADNSIFLATDHAPTIIKFKDIFGSNLYSFANVPDNNGKSIHYNHKSILPRQFNIDCFVDLLLLASGSKLYLSHIINDHPSGYGLLARNLHNNKELLRQLTA